MADQDPREQAQVSFAPQAHSMLYSDFAQITINPHSAMLRFGTQVPGQNQFVVHTQIAMPPQALVAFANAIQQHLASIEQAQRGGQPAGGSGLMGPDGPIDLGKIN